VFAQLYGTLLLLAQSEQQLIKGLIINKFRGNVDILKPGLKMLEDVAQKPVIGVLPYLQVDIEDEDSLSERLSVKQAVGQIDVAVIRLPKISN
ncbi:MAG: cobyric acid synthase CobQ, partial [Clostridiales bacterium]